MFRFPFVYESASVSVCAHVYGNMLERMTATYLGSDRGGFHKTTSSPKVTFDLAKIMEQHTATKQRGRQEISNWTLCSKTSKKRSRLFVPRDMTSVRSWRHESCASKKRSKEPDETCSLARCPCHHRHHQHVCSGRSHDDSKPSCRKTQVTPGARHPEASRQMSCCLVVIE